MSRAAAKESSAAARLICR